MTNIESGLKKVDLGRSDGWCFAMIETDAVLKKLNLQNIKRWNYKTFEVRIVLPKNDRGKEVNEILSKAIRKLKQNGKYQSIMKVLLNQKYEEWK